jgi:hypothetical protein
MIKITEKRLLDLGFTLNDNDLYELNLVNIKTPEFNRIDIWARSERGLRIFVDISEGVQPDQTSTELPHIKHIDELQNLFFALTGTYLEYKPNICINSHNK